jgi:hypothetical protein
MGIAKGLEEIRQHTSKRTNPFYCAYQALYDSLTPEDQKALDEAWAKGYSVNEVLMVLRKEGYKSSNESIRKHRIGGCKCPKK